jgi:prepilin-type N-terminal cleavage/methylation domain-containing protein
MHFRHSIDAVMKSNPPHRRGFTLLELVVSMGIGAAVLGVAAGVLGTAGDGYEVIGAGVATEREARAAMTRLAADLSSACHHKSMIANRSTAVWPVDGLGIFTLQPAQAQSDAGRIGDLCAVYYYVQDLLMSGKSVRCLMRGCRDSDAVFSALRGNATARLFAPDPARDEPLAMGVVSFEARPQIRDATGGWTDWDPTAITGPQAIAIRLVLAHRKLAAKLHDAADWDGGSTQLGKFSAEERNGELEIYQSTMRYGNPTQP